jgi:putative transposase
MADINFDYHPQFFTATILEWKPLLTEDEYKDIIIKSLLFLKNEGRVVIYGFVIMPNHIHLIWQIQDGFKRGDDPKSLFKIYSTADEIQTNGYK